MMIGLTQCRCLAAQKLGSGNSTGNQQVRGKAFNSISAAHTLHTEVNRLCAGLSVLY